MKTIEIHLENNLSQYADDIKDALTQINGITHIEKVQNDFLCVHLLSNTTIGKATKIIQKLEEITTQKNHRYIFNYKICQKNYNEIANAVKSFQPFIGAGAKISGLMLGPANVISIAFESIQILSLCVQAMDSLKKIFWGNVTPNTNNLRIIVKRNEIIIEK